MNDLQPITVSVGMAYARMEFLASPPSVQVTVQARGSTIVLTMVELCRLCDILRAGTRTLPKPDWP